MDNNCFAGSNILPPSFPRRRIAPGPPREDAVKAAGRRAAALKLHVDWTPVGPRSQAGAGRRAASQLPRCRCRAGRVSPGAVLSMSTSTWAGRRRRLSWRESALRKDGNSNPRAAWRPQVSRRVWLSRSRRAAPGPKPCPMALANKEEIGHRHSFRPGHWAAITNGHSHVRKFVGYGGPTRGRARKL